MMVQGSTVLAEAASGLADAETAVPCTVDRARLETSSMDHSADERIMDQVFALHDAGSRRGVRRHSTCA